MLGLLKNQLILQLAPLRSTGLRVDGEETDWRFGCPVATQPLLAMLLQEGADSDCNSWQSIFVNLQHCEIIILSN